MRRLIEQGHEQALLSVLLRAPETLIAYVTRQVQKEWQRGSRAILLEPNRGSALKIEKYAFGITAPIEALGTACDLEASNSPDVNFRPQRVSTNVTMPGMVFLDDARVANVSFIVGGTIDAWQWSVAAVGSDLDLPTITPANKAWFSAEYTGVVPAGFDKGAPYRFGLSLTGPASICA